MHPNTDDRPIVAGPETEASTHVPGVLTPPASSCNVSKGSAQLQAQVRSQARSSDPCPRSWHHDQKVVRNLCENLRLQSIIDVRS